METLNAQSYYHPTKMCAVLEPANEPDEFLKGHCDECDILVNEDEAVLTEAFFFCSEKCRDKFEEKRKEDIEKELLKLEKAEQEKENFKEGEINWLVDDYWNDWDKVKGHTKNLLGHHEDYYEDDDNKLFFLSHDKDTIRGKPQLIEQVQKKIPLIKVTIKKVKEKEGQEIIEKEIKKIFTIGERCDVRYDGYLKDTMAEDFWLYRIISEDGKEYYVLTQEKLPNCTCNFKGMLVELDDFAEFSRSMKIKSLSRLFFMKSFEPDIKILTKEQLIEFTKARKINGVAWLDFLAYHRFGNYNRFPEDVELLRSSFILSGKFHEYPLHMFIFGVPGTKKTKGWIETLSHKFEEEPDICEGGVSSMKGLEPSFKDKPADIGYLARKERMAWVDEIGKMIEKLGVLHHRNITGALGTINFLLEHVQRKALTGNDKLDVQATAKAVFLTNPIQSHQNVYEHIGLLDPSTLSRFLVWVQDYEETKYLLGNKSIEKVSRCLKQAPQSNENKKNEVVSCKLSRKYIVENIDMCRIEFLSLFDTCYNFTCEIDEGEVERIVKGTTQLAKEPMKSSVWIPRAFHHTYLLVDGLCKHRCLFEDYDASFTAKQQDYDRAERILIRMVKGWDTILTPKGEMRT